MPTDLILKQAFVWGAGIGMGIASLNAGIQLTAGFVNETRSLIKKRRTSKA